MEKIFNEIIQAIKHDNVAKLKSLMNNIINSTILYLHISTPKDMFLPLQSFIFDFSAAINSLKCCEYLANEIPIQICVKTNPITEEEEEEESVGKREDIIDISNDNFEILTILTILTYHPDENKEIEEEEHSENNNFVSLTDWFVETNYDADELPETVFEAFYIAANNDIISIVEYLLSFGLDGSRISKFGTTVYNGVVFKKNYKLIDIFYEYFVNQTPDANGRYPLHFASKIKDPEMAEYLLEIGGDPSVKDNLYGFTPLHLSAKIGAVDVIEVLINYDAPYDAKDFSGRTPMHIAAAYGQTASCEALYDLGAEPNIEDNEGMTPLNISTLRKKKKTAKFFESLGLDNANLGTTSFLKNQKPSKEKY